MLFDVEVYRQEKRVKVPFVERIRPFLEGANPKIKCYFGAPQRTLGRLLAKAGIGACVSPTTKKHFDSYGFYFLDNGAFRYWIRGEEFKDGPFFSLVEASLKAEKRADFLVLPDLIGQGLKSLEFSSLYAEKLKGTGIPFALALQDGMEKDTSAVADFVREYGVKVLFVGGTTEWKWRTAPFWNALAKELSISCHVGRVPSAKRVYQARRMEVDSIDTTAVLWEERKMVSYLRALSVDLVGVPLLVNYSSLK